MSDELRFPELSSGFMAETAIRQAKSDRRATWDELVGGWVARHRAAKRATSLKGKSDA